MKNAQWPGFLQGGINRGTVPGVSYPNLRHWNELRNFARNPCPGNGQKLCMRSLRRSIGKSSIR